MTRGTTLYTYTYAVNEEEKQERALSIRDIYQRLTALSSRFRKFPNENVASFGKNVLEEEDGKDLFNYAPANFYYYFFLIKTNTHELRACKTAVRPRRDVHAR